MFTLIKRIYRYFIKPKYPYSDDIMAEVRAIEDTEPEFEILHYHKLPNPLKYQLFKQNISSKKVRNAVLAAAKVVFRK